MGPRKFQGNPWLVKYLASFGQNKNKYIELRAQVSGDPIPQLFGYLSGLNRHKPRQGAGWTGLLYAACLLRRPLDVVGHMSWMLWGFAVDVAGLGCVK